jgi:hypothetical protein
MGSVKSMFQDRIEAAQDRGAIDAYYGHSGRPRIVLDPLGKTIVPKENMSKEEIKAYWEGYDNQDDRKDYGNDVSE